MRRSRRAIVAIVLLAVVLLLAMTVPAMAETGTKSPKPSFDTGRDWVDPTPEMLGAKEQAIRAFAAKYGAAATIPSLVGAEPAPAFMGMHFTVDVSDNDPNHAGVYTEDFIVVGIGDHGIMCITQDAYNSFDGSSYHFANPNGDGSETWLRTEDLITPSQLSYMLNIFDDVIYPTEASNFGTPLPRGSDGQKVWMLLFNIRDEAYYDPSAESYIAGYFSSSEDSANNKNMIHIDTYNWEDRIGPNADRPYLYEGVFAHEYEHLLHADSDPDEESWIDEGMADLAAFMCGFMEDQGHVIEFIQYHPYIGLTFFGGSLADYGSAYLFQLYLWENYGMDAFTSALFHDQDNGIAGVQNQLDAFGNGVKFDKVYDNWTLANYFDTMGPSAYGYKNLNIGPDTDGWTIQYMLDEYYNPWSTYPYGRFGLMVDQPGWILGSWFYWDYFGYGTPGLPYTAHYYYFEPSNTIKVTLDGESISGVSPYAGTQQMISGTGAWTYRSFYRSMTVPAAGDSTLEFATWYHMEGDWDYFYVEVYDQTTDEWYTMPLTSGATTYTTQTLPQPQDNPNVPAGRDPEDYFAASRWNGLTGFSGGWVNLETSLNQFQGDDITVYFRTWQDGAFTYEGAYVDDVLVTLGGVADPLETFETDMGLWATPAAEDVAGWARGTGLTDNNWQGTLVYMAKKGINSWRSAPNLYSRLTFSTVKTFATPMDADTDSGTIKPPRISSFRTTPQWLYVVSNRTEGLARADYLLGVQK